MNKTIVLAVFSIVLLGFSGSVFATGKPVPKPEPTSQSQDQSQHQSQNSTNINNNTTNVGVGVGVDVDLNIEGSQSTSISTSTLTVEEGAIGGGAANAELVIEEGGIKTGDNTNLIVFESHRPLPNTPYVDIVNTELAYLVHTSATLEEVDLEFVLGYYNLCPMVFTEGDVPKIDTAVKKQTGNWFTRLPIASTMFRRAKVETKFAPHPSLSNNLGNLSGLNDSINLIDPEETKLRCVGIMHARSVSVKETVNLPELDTSTASHAMKLFDGMGKIFLVSNRSVIATPHGVSSDSNAFGAGLGIAKAMTDRIVGTGTGSGAINRANSRPITNLGRTYAVFVADPNGFVLPKPEKVEEPKPETPAIETPIAEAPPVENSTIPTKIIEKKVVYQPELVDPL